MKILYVQHASELGGSAVSLKLLIQGLQKCHPEYQLHLLSIIKNNKLKEFYRGSVTSYAEISNQVTLQHNTANNLNLLNIIDIGRLLLFLVKLPISIFHSFAYFRKQDCNIVHLNSSVLVPQALGAWIANKKVVWHIREQPYHGIFGFRIKLLNLIFHKIASKVIFICKADKESWGGGRNSKVVYNPLPLEFEGCKKRDIDDARINFLFMGGVNPIKGLMVVLRSLALLKHQRPDLARCVKLTVFGLLYERPKTLHYRMAKLVFGVFGWKPSSVLIEEYILKHNLESFICRKPCSENIIGSYQASDVVLFPATKPHFGRPLFEGASCGLCPVATDFPAMREIITNKESGFLFPNGDHESLFIIIVNLISTPSVIRDFGQVAKKYSDKRHNAQLHAAKVLKIYQDK
jgi:glycosyltransferase involved in cell wall biosynthesis